MNVGCIAVAVLAVATSACSVIDAVSGSSSASDGDAGTSSLCGNGEPDPGEVCDDGNTNDGDGCRGDCRGNEECGDELTDEGEDCDDGNMMIGDGCRPDCTIERCHDGIEDPDEICFGEFFSVPLTVQMPAENPIVVADFDNDLFPDVVTITNSVNEMPNPPRVHFLRSDGTGGFNDPVSTDFGYPVESMAAGDVTGDFFPDLVVGTRLILGESVVAQFDGPSSTFPAASTQQFDSGPDLAVVVKLADLNGTGIPSIIVGNRAFGDPATSTVTIYDASATPIIQQQTMPAPDGLVDIVVGNFAGDDLPDLAIISSANDDRSVGLLVGLPDGTFSPRIPQTLSVFVQNAAAGDFNRDDRLDLVVGDPASSRFILLLNDGMGNFTEQPVASATPGGGIHLVRAGDLDADGDLDAIGLGQGRELWVLRNRAVEQFDTVGPIGNFEPAQDGRRFISMELADLDSNGRLEIAVAELAEAINLVRIYTLTPDP